MRRYILIALSLIVLAGCSIPIRNHMLECDVPNKELFDGIIAVLTEYDFNIKSNFPNTGILVLETPMELDWGGMHTKHIWALNVNSKGLIKATAKTIREDRNAYGNTIQQYETYYGDGTPKDLDWYWIVRERLEAACNNKIIIVETKKNI